MGGAKNCPETPRQKMIGMMYLVLTAMLALNVSAAILNGYTQVDESLHATIETTESQNTVAYKRFTAALEQNPEKTQQWYDKAMEVKTKSQEMFDYIQKFKDDLVSMSGGAVDKETKMAVETNATVRQISKADDTNNPERYGINDGHATELKNKILEYSAFLKDMADDEAFDATIDATFDVSGGKNAEGHSVSWEESIFKEMPLCAVITVLTKIQNDVRNFEGKTVNLLYQGTDAGDIRVNKLSAYVIPSSDYVIRGSRYRAQIILAAVDSTQTPEYYINGNKIDASGASM